MKMMTMMRINDVDTHDVLSCIIILAAVGPQRTG
jgi:hypothetical protein